MSTKVIKVATSERGAPACLSKAGKSAARQAARAIREGKLVAFATETVYGVGAMATDALAMEKLRDLKSRPARPFSVHLGSPDDVFRYVADPCKPARRLMTKAWPGPVTLLLPTGGKLAEKRLQSAGLHEVLTADGAIGLRCPDEPVAQAILSAVAAPVVAASANRAKAPSPRKASEVLASLDGAIDLLIDSGPTKYGQDSTIVRFDGDEAVLVRRGVLDGKEIERLLVWRLLLVCTGNTCRSPMAEGIARRLLAEKLRCDPDDLAGEGVEVISAGVFAADGMKPSAGAVQAAGRLGADISCHRSRKLTSDLIRSSDAVLCMTASHVGDVLRLHPPASGRAERLDEKADIPDPVSGGQEVYFATAQRIGRALKARLGGMLTR